MPCEDLQALAGVGIPKPQVVPMYAGDGARDIGAESARQVVPAAHIQSHVEFVFRSRARKGAVTK